MDTFMVEQLKKRWPRDADGRPTTLLHVYFVPAPAEIKPLIDAYRDLIDETDCVARQPDEWLHSTVLVVDGIPASEVTAAQRAELEQHLREALASMPTFTVDCGPALAGRSTIALDLTPDKHFRELIERAQSAAGAVFGDEVVQYSNGRPHITLGYACGDGDSGVIQGKLRAATDLRVPLTVNSVRLVDTHVDDQLFQFRWEELATIPLQRTD